MRYQKTNNRRAVILMVVLSLLALFALVGVSFVLYADAEAAAARVAREAQTQQAADVNPKEALAFFLGQLIYDVPDTPGGAGSGLRGHSLARTMYGFNYTVPVPTPGLNTVPFAGIGRLHYGCPSMTYPATPLNNVPANWGTQLDDYAMVNYTWFANDGFVRDPERFGIRTNAQLQGFTQTNPYVAGNAPYTYPDLNSFFLAAVRADGTVLTPSYHRPWLFQMVNGTFYAFNDMTNPNWTNPQGKYLTLRPRPAEHPLFPLPGDATGDVKNLTWAPGGNDSIWIDLGAPVMTAPDGTLYKMMFAPLIMDLDGRVNLNTAGNILASAAALTASSGAAGAAAWQLASGAHVSNQGWGPWEVNLSKVLYGDQTLYPTTTPPTPPEWMRLFTGMSYAITNPPGGLVVQSGAIPPAVLPPTLSAWLTPGVPGRYMESVPGGIWTPNVASLLAPLYPSALGLNTTYSHAYAMADINGMNETANVAASSRPLMPGAPANPLTSDPVANPAINPFASFQQGYNNGNAVEATNHPLLYNIFRTPFINNYFTRTFTAQDMGALLRPNASITGPVDANASSINSDLLRLCPLNFPSDSTLANLPAAIKSLAMRYRNLVTTQSWDIGAPGVSAYWWNGMISGYLTNNSTSYLQAPFASQPMQGAAVGFPAQPIAAVGNLPNSNPILSEFGLDGSAVSASLLQYLATSYIPYPGGTPPGYVTPGARIRLNRPLPPYPHMGAGLMPPYTLPPNVSPSPNVALSPYGVAYNTTPGNPIYNQYLAAQQARQALANDIYRRLLSLAGLPKVLNQAAPTNVELAPRRWLAQLAVNIVDYIDEDDIMTPFNFYTVADGLPAAPPATTIGLTQGFDDDYLNNNQPTTAYKTGQNPVYWVFGTEMPKVVLNEVIAQAINPDPTQAVANDNVKVWVELFNTMTVSPGTNTQPQDGYRVPLYMTVPGSPTGYSPYIITMAPSLYTVKTTQNLMPDLVSSGNMSGALLPDDSCNVLGKANNLGAGPKWPGIAAPYPLPTSTTYQEFSVAGNVQQMGGGAQPANASSPTVGVGIDPTGATDITGKPLSPFFLIGPPIPVGNNYLEAFGVAGAGGVPGPNGGGVPPNTPVLRTPSLSYTPSWNQACPPNDERVTGLSVLLRRLANPYLPLQPDPSQANYNPYVTVDYLANVPIKSNQGLVKGTTETLSSRGKKQPYAALTLLQLLATSAQDNQLQPPANPPNPPPNPPPPPGSFSPSPVAIQQGAGTFQTNNGNNSSVVNTFGLPNVPLPDSGHYDWLVHLDRPPISPMELLHVSAWPPHMLTQRFITNYNAGGAAIPGVNPGSDNLTNATNTYNPPNLANALNMFGHYAPWFDAPPAGVTAATLSSVSCPWWFDLAMQTGPSSHRLHRLFEFLECGDRAFGVNGLGRIPGKVNINTIWDSEILQALIDANLSMGITPSPSNVPLNVAGDPVAQVFANMMASRSPSYYNGGTYTNPIPIGPVNMGTGADDRPFMPLSTGLNLGKSSGCLQFPNGFSVTTDTILRTNNPFGKAPTYPTPGAAGNNLYLLFQNYNDTAAGGAVTTSAVHPYLQTQMLTKLYNNVTTRSNTFAVFLTVGFFQVTDATTTPPTLGPEIGRSEGKEIRHRMFAIVDRTNLSTFTTTGQVVPPATSVTGPTPNPSNLTAPINFTGLQTVQLPAPVLGPNLTVTGNATQLFVANPTTGMPGLIQAGTQLVIDAGTPFEETVTVIGVTPPVGTAPATITANFTLTHGAGGLPFTITQRGNPGPWLLIPYDPRLDPAVVPYFSIIE